VPRQWFRLPRPLHGQYCIYDNAYVDVKPGENCPDCGRPTETVTEANFYFKLSAFQKPLLDWYAKHPDFIQPEARRNEILSFVEGGLRDLSITRTLGSLGYSRSGRRAARFLRWFDALTAYLSAVAARSTRRPGSGPPISICRQRNHPFPLRVLACFPDGRRTSATETNLGPRLAADGQRQNEQVARQCRSPEAHRACPRNDALRYYLLRETVFGQDGNFSYDALVQRYNSDLANVSEILLVARQR